MRDSRRNDLRDARQKCNSFLNDPFACRARVRRRAAWYALAMLK